MTLVGNFTLFVNNHDVRYSAYRINFTAGRSISPVVLNCSPSLLFDMSLQGFHIAVNTKTDNSNTVLPISLSFCDHITIVLHWSLARWAPGSPEINHPNFTFNMFKTYRFCRSHQIKILNGLILISCSQ